MTVETNRADLQESMRSLERLGYRLERNINLYSLRRVKWRARIALARDIAEGMLVLAVAIRRERKR